MAKIEGTNMGTVANFCALAGTVDDFVPADGPMPPNTGLQCVITITKYSTLLNFLL